MFAQCPHSDILFEVFTDCHDKRLVELLFMKPENKTKYIYVGQDNNTVVAAVELLLAMTLTTQMSFGDEMLAVRL